MSGIATADATTPAGGIASPLHPLVLIMIHLWKEYAARLISYGTRSDLSLPEFIERPGDNIHFDNRALLVALLDEIKGLRRDIKSLPARIERERVKAARAEAEAPRLAEMKLADKQRRAAEAKVMADRSAPVEIVEAVLPSRELERAWGNGRVRKVF